MTEQRSAGDVFELALVRHERRGRRWLGVLGDLIGSVLWTSGGIASVGEYVVRRKATGEEILRTDAGSGEETAALRLHLQRQLDELSEDEFLRTTWAVPGD